MTMTVGPDLIRFALCGSSIFIDLPAFGSSKTCKYPRLDVQCGPEGLKGSPDNLYHNNGDGTFTDVSKKAGVDDPQHRFGLTSIWSDFNNDGRSTSSSPTMASPIIFTATMATDI